MFENQLQEFNPTVQELTTIAENYRGLKIINFEDKEGIEKVKTAKKELSEKRNYITKTLKSLREGAIKFQKDVISKEKELVGIIEPVENELKLELERVKKEQEMEERKAILPMRMNELISTGYNIEGKEEILQNSILGMDDNEFMIYLNSVKAEIFEEQKRKLEKIEKEKQEKENEEKRQKELEIEKEKIRIETENKIKEQQEKEKQLEIIKQKEIENGKLFQEFLLSNGYNENTKNDYFISYGETTILYKKIAEFSIKN